MSALPFMKLYTGDYLADTGHLSTMEHGAYLLLIMAYWQNGGPLKDDDRRLARQAKATPQEWEDLRPVVSEFFSVSGGHWHHKRIDADLEQAAEKSSKARDAAAKRWDSERNATGDASAMQTHMQSDMQTQCERISRRNASQKSEVRSHISDTRIQTPDNTSRARGADSPVAQTAVSVTPPSRKKPSPVAIPDWLDADLWADWLDHRKRIRKPMTDRAQQLLLGRLEKHRTAGHNIRELMETAIMRGWLDVYPQEDKPNGRNGRNGKSSGPRMAQIGDPIPQGAMVCTGEVYVMPEDEEDPF